MKISIITPTLNQGEFIEDTIRSVLDQDHRDVEHIVIDGGSTDGTLEILKRFTHLLWTSGKDGGQAEAINRGFRAAGGEVIAWLNSDDYYDANILGAVAAYFDSHPECMMLYGDISYVSRDRRFLYSLTGDTITYAALVRSPDIVRQPSFFWRKSILEEVGYLDEGLHLVMDFDFILRIARRHSPHYLKKNLSFFRWYEQSKTASRQRRQVLELHRVYRKNHVRPGFRGYRFLLGKYLDTLEPGNPLRRSLALFRKKRPAV